MAAAWGCGSRGLLPHIASNLAVAKLPLCSRTPAGRQRLLSVSQVRKRVGLVQTSTLSVKPIACIARCRHSRKLLFMQHKSWSQLLSLFPSRVVSICTILAFTAFSVLHICRIITFQFTQQFGSERPGRPRLCSWSSMTAHQANLYMSQLTASCLQVLRSGQTQMVLQCHN